MNGETRDVLDEIMRGIAARVRVAQEALALGDEATAAGALEQLRITLPPPHARHLRPAMEDARRQADFRREGGHGRG